MNSRRLLLAGSVGPERTPSRRDPDDADWFLPLHLRDTGRARDRIASHITSGADIVVAPTWLTHRRALLPLAETRRAGDWTAAAVRLAREGVEIGLERREGALAEGPVPEGDIRRGRPRPLVAASLPALSSEEEAGADGRLLPREAATERDYRDQAGLLAEAQPDLLLVEGWQTPDETSLAVEAAASTGLPVWSAAPEQLWHTDPDARRARFERWAAACRDAGAELLLGTTAPDLADAFRADADGPWGAHLSWIDRDHGRSLQPDALVTETQVWLAAGATAIAMLDGVRSADLAAVREAIDALDVEVLERIRAGEARWLAHVAGAAAIAPGGKAVWLGRAPDAPLPDGFDWLVVPADEARRLPRDHYRLVVAAEAAPGAVDLPQRGGVLVTADGSSHSGGQTLRLLTIDDAGRPPLSIYRRED